MANPYMGLIMFSFGLMKCSFDIPVLGVVLIGVFLILLAFAFAVLESRRIKTIEPYRMLIAE